jgi:hypothetical protein
MVGQLDAISRRLKDNRVRQRHPVERLWSKGTFAIDTDASNLANGVKGLVQGFHGWHLESQMVEPDVLATIKKGGTLIRLPNSKQRRPIREEKGGIGFDSANLLVAERFKEFKRRIEVSDGETDVGDADSQVAGVCHFEVVLFCVVLFCVEMPVLVRDENEDFVSNTSLSQGSHKLASSYPRDLSDCSFGFDLREQDSSDCSSKAGCGQRKNGAIGLYCII